MGGKKARDKRKVQRKAEEATAQAAVAAATPAAAAGAGAGGAAAASASASASGVTTKYVSMSGAAAAPAAGGASRADDSDDDKPELSAYALAALKEFYAEKKETETALKKATQDITSNKQSDGSLAIGAFTEDYGLSQFWYAPETIEQLVTAGLAAAGPNGSIACVCTPSLYAAFRQRAGPGNSVYVLEFDQRFKAYSGFVFYDYKHPLSVKLPRGSIDVCVVDPPFLAPECLEKVAHTVAYLTKPNPRAVTSPAANAGFGRVILCTGAVMEETARTAMTVLRTTFVPRHRAQQLKNDFRCYVNFPSDHLPFAAGVAGTAAAVSAPAAAAAAAAAAAPAAGVGTDDAQAKALAAALATLSTAPVPESKGRRFIIGGAPGSGKGTQCDLIKAKFGCVHVSTGDLLRAEVKAGSALGVEAKGYMTRGELVPDPIVFGLLCRRLRQPDCQQHGWLLDGFPRTAHEIALLQGAGIVPECFLLVDVPDAVLLARITGRRVDPDTGKTYHVSALPADEAVRKRLVQRKDDTADALTRRLADFHKHNDAVLGSYQAVLHRVNGDQTPDKVFAALCAGIGARAAL